MFAELGATQRKVFGLNEECIHGLDGVQCALCFPKAAPEVTAATRPTRARAASRPVSLRSVPSNVPPAGVRFSTTHAPAAPRVAGAGKPAVADNVGEQRVYHLTHIDNLAAILESGRLFADANTAWGARPAVDISSTETRDARRAARVDGDDSPAVASYVPFFLSPDSSVWNSIRAEMNDPRLSPAGKKADAYDFVLLVSTVKAVFDATTSVEHSQTVVVGEADAALATTGFGVAPEFAQQMLRKLRADPSSDAILTAELLVADSVPFGSVSLIGVANDKVRDAVRAILAPSGYSTKTVVYPPWFQASDADN